MHVLYDPSKEDWTSFFSQQIGGAYYQGVPQQRGFGDSYYVGFPHQRGYGIGAIFANLGRFLLPIVKSIGKNVGREALFMGSRVLDDLATGEKLKESIVKEGTTSIKNLAKQTHDRLQSGQGKNYRRKSLIGHAVTIKPIKRSRKKDSLDL